MAWDQTEVAAAQNAEQTNFSMLDAQLAGRSDYNVNRFAGDSRLHVAFSMRPLVNEEESAKAQRPIYEDREFIQIMIPGDKQNIILRVAEDFDRQRFAEHYAKFKAGASQVIGTPLANAGIFPASRCEEFAHFGIRTVEQLANANDNLAPRFMGFHGDKAAAGKWLARLSSGDVLLKKIEELESQVRELKSAPSEPEVHEPPVRHQQSAPRPHAPTPPRYHPNRPTRSLM